MSSFDAAPLPRLGQVFFDVRGSSRSMRVSWYGDTGVAVFSIWQGGRCTGTFRLPVDDLARMVDTLRDGPDGEPAGPDGPDAGRGYPEQDFREPDFREPDFREPDFRDAGFRDSGPGTPPLPDLPPGPPGPDLMGSGRRPAGRPAAGHAAGHTVEVDPADPLGLGYSDDAAAGYRDGGFPAASDPYGPYSSADTGPRYPAEPAYPADLAYGPPEGGYPGDREPDYPGASHGDYPRGDSAYPAGDPGYLPGGGPGDYAGGGAPDYLSGSPRRPSADHAPPYDSWPGPDSGAHSDPQGWDRDYPDSGDGDYGYAPPGSGSARHSR